MAFRAVAKECGYDFRLLDEVMRINEDQRHRFLKESAQCSLDAPWQNVWAFSDWRSKAGPTTSANPRRFCLCRNSCCEGCYICAHDPAAMDRAKEVLPATVEYTSGPYEAATGADALLILTEWEEFAGLELDRLRKLLKYPIVIDGRNLYDPAVMSAHGFSYYSVGRPETLTEDSTAAVRPDQRHIF